MMKHLNSPQFIALEPSSLGVRCENDRLWKVAGAGFNRNSFQRSIDGHRPSIKSAFTPLRDGVSTAHIRSRLNRPLIVAFEEICPCNQILAKLQF